MIEWIFPVRCPICNQIVVPKGVMFHLRCIEKLEFIVEPLCKKCGVPLASEEQEYCEECILKDRGWDFGRSVFYYRGAVQRALYQMKQEGTREFVHFFALQMKKTQKDYIREVGPDCLVPVPLHPSKFRKRGFNQAELLARDLSNEIQIPIRLLLKKKRKTKDQKNLNRKERKKNIENVFCVDKEETKKGIPKSVLLIDDVSTTGSTLTECAKVLKKQGVQKVAFLSVCAGEQLG